MKTTSQQQKQNICKLVQRAVAYVNSASELDVAATLSATTLPGAQVCVLNTFRRAMLGVKHLIK